MMRMNEVRQEVPLAPYTTLGVGGSAERFVTVASEAGLAEAASEARRLGQPITVLGGGSNMLVADAGVRGTVIKNEIKGIEASARGEVAFVEAGAGEIWDDLVAYTVAQGWWGLENLSAIPGTVGATPIQNVGAYGVEVGEFIEAVRAYDIERDEVAVLSQADCHFGYRDSIFKSAAGRRYLIVSVRFRLSTVPRPQLHYKDLAARFVMDDRPAAAMIREAVREIRAEKFPDWRELGTAGSFFKNPNMSAAAYAELHSRYPGLPGFPESDGRMKVSLGWILDKICGLRGYREGNVGLYDRQALVLVNYGGATAAEVSAFADKVSEVVFAKTGVRIEREPVLVG